MSRILAMTATAMVLASSLAFGQADRKDLQVLKNVSRSVLSYPRYTVFDDVSASVNNGVVTLTGKVTMPYKVDDLGRAVSRVQGVRQVRNELKVLPTSLFDDELRYKIARAIYGNPEFWNYAVMVNPPIHIIVDNGRVTLTGVVNSNVERMMAQTLATSFNAFSVKNELKTDAEARAQFERAS